MDYNKEIKIDEDALDLEWLDQPDKMLAIATKTAEARLEMDKASDNVDLVRSELDKELRENPEKYDLEKTTDTVVKEAIVRQPEYQEARKEFLKARFNYEVYKGASTAFEQRKSSLENLVKLHGQSYFAGPQVPRDLSQKRQEQKELDKKTSSNVGRKLKRRK